MSAILAILASALLNGVAPANPQDLAARIAAAGPGETVALEPGVYAGGFRIDRPLKLIGQPGAIIDGGGSGDVIEITSPDVEIRGLVIRNTGTDLDKENVAIRVLAPRATIADNTLEDVLFGVDLKSAPDCVIQNNVIGGKALDIARRGDGIRLWRADRCLIEGNTIHDGRDAILWYSENVTVRGNVSRNCRYGFHLMFSNSVTLEGNELSGNSVGVYFMYSKQLVLRENRIQGNRGPSGYGIGLKDVDEYTIERNIIGNNRVGIYLDDSPFTPGTTVRISGNTIAANDIGMTFLPNVEGNLIVENNFVDNIEQISVSGRGDIERNEFAVDGRGNFWSDYIGYDGDGDGVGEIEHSPQKLFENLLDREPKLRILLFSPAQQAIEFIGRAIPAVQPEPKFTDPSPLTQPREFAAAGTRPGRGGMTAVAGTLLGLSAGLMFALGPSRRSGGAS